MEERLIQVGFISIKCRHFKQCGNYATWVDTDTGYRDFYCDECKRFEEEAAGKVSNKKLKMELIDE